MTILVVLAGGLRVEQAGQRHMVPVGEAIIVDESRPSRSDWHNVSALIIRTGRDAQPRPTELNGIGGRRLGRTHPILKLTRAYSARLHADALQDGGIEESADRTLNLLLGAMMGTSGARLSGSARQAVAAARLAAMRDIMERGAADANLRMDDVASAVDVGARRSHQLLEAAGIRFSDMLVSLRLARVAADLGDSVTSLASIGCLSCATA